MTKNRVPLLLAALACIALVALFVVRNRQRNVTTNTVKIVAIVAQTGKAGYIGSAEAKVLHALKNGWLKSNALKVPIDLVIEDSAGDPDQAVTLFRNWSKDSNVVAVIGPSTSGESLFVAPLADEFEIPLLSLAASRKITLEDAPNGQERTRKWVFKFAQNDSLAAIKLLQAMQLLHHSRIALLYSADGYGKSGAEVFQQELQKVPGMNIIHNAAYPPALDRPEGIVAAIPKDAQAVLVWGTAPGPAVIIQELKRAQFKGQIYLSHGNASKEFIAAAGPSCEDAIVVGSRVLRGSQSSSPQGEPDKEIESIFKLWKDHKLDGAPSQFGGYARDSLMMCVEVLQNLPKPDRQSLRDGIEAQRNWHGVTGSFTFGDKDHAGLSGDSFEIYRVVKGDFSIWTPPQ